MPHFCWELNQRIMFWAIYLVDLLKQFRFSNLIFCIFSQIQIHQKRHNQNSPEILQEYLAILAAGRLQLKFLRFFVQLSRYLTNHTETCSNKIDGQLITKAVLEDTGVLANFSKLKSNINCADNEITNIFWKISFICT